MSAAVASGLERQQQEQASKQSRATDEQSSWRRTTSHGRGRQVSDEMLTAAQRRASRMAADQLDDEVLWAMAEAEVRKSAASDFSRDAYLC